MKPRWAPTAVPGQIDLPGNDSRHNQRDLNQGGGPRPSSRTIPQNQRGGTQQQGRDRVSNAGAMTAGRSGSGNPASRGATPQNFKPEQRVPGHGGSPQKPIGARPHGGGFGHSGQKNVPSYPHANPKPAAGNTRGASYRMIAGRFKRASMGARSTQGDSMGGRYGAPPVNTNT